MLKLIQKCQHLDAFGVPLTLKLQDKKSIYKSSLGGVVTLVIYVLSALYSINVFYQWWSNQLSPKSSSSQYITDHSLIDFNYTILNVQFFSYAYDKIINPFDPKKCILLPMLFGVANISGSTIFQSMLNDSIWDTNNRDSPSLYSIQLNSGINLYGGNGETQSDYDYTIVFVKCNSSYLTEGQQCASDELHNQFFQQQAPFLQISLRTKVFNSDNKFVDNQITWYISLEETLFYALNLELKSTRYQLKENLFTTSAESSESITGADTFGQTNTGQYAIKTYGIPSYAAIYIQLQAIQTQSIIEYQHIGELLAQIGSILSILFMIKYIISEINETLLWDNIYDEVISYYYPEYKSIQITRSLRGKTQSVRLSGQVLDVEEYDKQVKKLRMKVQEKLTLNNLLYEIFRIHFLLRSTYPLKDIQQCHNLGIKFSIHDHILSEHQLSESEDEAVLNDEDFDCLSLASRNKLSVKEMITSKVQPYFTNLCPSSV